jgi:hypothetical protein
MADSKTNAPRPRSATHAAAQMTARQALEALDALTQQVAALRAALPTLTPEAPAERRESPCDPNGFKALFLAALQGEHVS